MDSFMADHGNRCGDQTRERKKKEAPLERKDNVCCIQRANYTEEHQKFGPGFGRGSFKKAFFLQFFSQICHWMCTHHHHQRAWRYTSASKWSLRKWCFLPHLISCFTRTWSQTMCYVGSLHRRKFLQQPRVNQPYMFQCIHLGGARSAIWTTNIRLIRRYVREQDPLR